MLNQNRSAEIKKKANAAGGESEICEHLRIMHCKQLIDCFQFYHNAVSDEKIETVRIFNQEIFIAYGAEFLFFEMHSLKSKLTSQCTLIGRLQQSGSELPMNFNSCPDNLFSQSIRFQIHGLFLCELCVGALCSL
jgi:hypothetical protein